MDPCNLRLLAELDDRRSMLEVVNLFLVHAPLQVKELQTSILAQHWDKVYRQAHMLKGSLSLVYAEEGIALLRQIEQFAIDPRGKTGVDRVLERFLALFADIESFLKETSRKLKEELT